MSILRIILGVFGVALAGLIVWASLNSGPYPESHGSFFQQGGLILSLPWGVVTLADLYLGFFLIGTVIFLAERNWVVALLWAAPLPFLGNVWAVVWLVVRLPFLAKQLSRPDWPTS